MRCFIRPLVVVICLSLVAGRVSAADRGVVLSGSWSSTFTWSGGVVPGASDNAFVGSTTPSGALSSATVVLTQDVTAGNVYLGHNTGTSGVLDLGDFTLTAQSLFFGFVGDGSIVRGTGHLDVQHFDIRAGHSFTLAPTDIVRSSFDVAAGSSLTLGANVSLSSDIDLRDNGTVFDAHGFNIVTGDFLLGWNNSGTPQFINRGTLTANRLFVRAQNFLLTPSDSVSQFIISAGATNLGSQVSIGTLELQNSATATTVETGNITKSVLLQSGSTLTLGANLVLSDTLDLRDAGTVLNAAGKDITATNQILLGWNGVGAVIQNRGKLTTGSFNVSGQSFNLIPADTIGNFTMNNGTTSLGAGVVVQSLTLSTNAVGTTAASGNIVQLVTMQSGSRLTLGANLALTDNLNISGAGTVLDANGHDISTPNQFLYGWDGSGTPVLQNVGKLNLGELLQSNGTQLTLTSGQDITGRLYIHGNSRLTAAVSAAGTGLTLMRTATSELEIEAGSHLTLMANGSVEGWALRWANPNGGDHVADLDNLIAQGQIDFYFQNTQFTISSNPDGYTYVLLSPVPEPASVMGFCALAAGLAAGVKRYRKPQATRHTT